MHCNSFYELAGLDPQNESPVSSIRGSSTPPRRHAVPVSGRPGIRCTKTLDQCPVFTFRLCGEVSYAALGTLRTLLSKVQLSHKNTTDRDFYMES